MSVISEPIKRWFGLEVKWRGKKINVEVTNAALESAKGALREAANQYGLTEAQADALLAVLMRELRVKVV